MSRNSLIVFFISVVVGALFTQQAAAWGTGGGISGGFKQAAQETDLYCDLNEDLQGIPGLTDFAQIETFPSHASPDSDPSHNFFGVMRCVEVFHNSCGTSCTLADRVPGSPIGVFNLEQQTDESFPEGGLVYTEAPDCDIDENCERQWSFIVERGAELLYTLSLVDADDGFGNAINDPGVFDYFCDNPMVLESCVAQFGLPTESLTSSRNPRRR